MGCGPSSPGAAAGRVVTPGGNVAFAAAGVPSRGGGASPLRGDACVLDGPGPHTPSSLRARRDAFWESRTSGAAAVWGSLKLACEAMLAGDRDLAATVLQAVDLHEAVRGDLSCVYEASGRAYEVPVWCWREPANLVTEAAAAREAAAAACCASARARRRPSRTCR